MSYADPRITKYLNILTFVHKTISVHQIWKYFSGRDTHHLLKKQKKILGLTIENNIVSNLTEKTVDGLKLEQHHV